MNNYSQTDLSNGCVFACAFSDMQKYRSFRTTPQPRFNIIRLGSIYKMANLDNYLLIK